MKKSTTKYTSSHDAFSSRFEATLFALAVTVFLALDGTVMAWAARAGLGREFFPWIQRPGIAVFCLITIIACVLSMVFGDKRHFGTGVGVARNIVLALAFNIGITSFFSAPNPLVGHL